ncbi:Cocaine esterase [Branchiostoma belcheri]|nr:Cocaine esterase [Branchiostoma belcheri]
MTLKVVILFDYLPLAVWQQTEAVCRPDRVVTEVEVYNGETKKFYHFSCPSNGCRLSTDPKEGDQQVVLDVDAKKGTKVLYPFHVQSKEWPVPSAVDHRTLLEHIEHCGLPGVTLHVEVFNVYTGKYYRFPCPSNGCHLSKDNAEANWQMFLHVDAAISGTRK